jgi:hypothetical protein
MLPAVGVNAGTIRAAPTSRFFRLGEKWGTTLLVRRQYACEAKRS